MNKGLKFIFVLLFSVLLLSCKRVPPITNLDLDGDLICDSSLSYPSHFLVSLSGDTNFDAPVLVTAHGYTATTFEWLEFELFAREKGVLVSRVLLGGHGRDYNTFKESTWKEWQKPIIEEYTHLVKAGFKNISLAGSSTGCPLTLDFLNSNAFDTLPAPKYVFFIDPIVIPSNKMLNYVGVLRYFIPFVTTNPTPEERNFWYHYRPVESLMQLHSVLKTVQAELKKKIILPPDTKMKVYKVKTDDSADPESAKWLYDGVKRYNGMAIDTVMLNSDKHVFTRLKGRESISVEDLQFQQNVFNEMVRLLKY